MTENTKQARNCTRDAVGSTLPVTTAVLIQDGPDKRTRYFIICSCELCSFVQLPAAFVQLTHSVTNRSISTYFSCHGRVSTCLAMLPVYHRLGSFWNSHNFFRPLRNFIFKINILFTYNIACAAVYSWYTAVHVAYVFN